MLKKVLWGLLAVVLIVIILMLSGVIKGDINTGGAQVKAVAAEEGTITREVFASGKMESKEIKEHYLSAPGHVSQILVKKGDTVKKGQELLRLSTTDLEEKLKQEQRQVALYTAEQEKFIKDEERTRKAAFETMKTEVSESGAPQTSTVPERSTADLKLYALKIQHAKENIALLEAKLSNNKVFASIDGVITDVLVKEGQEVVQGTQAFVVTNVSALQVKANVVEMDAAIAKTGMEVKVSGDAFPDEYKGTITYISPVAKVSEVDSRETVVEMIVDLAQTAEVLRPGLKATVQITVDNGKHVLGPLSAIKRDGQQSYVFKLVDGKAVKTNVRLGEEDDEKVELLEGVQAGDQLIDAPASSLQDGAQVVVQ
ncbi:efflux RND transporter periplasmic adaptor subunit [Paenibacillus sp. YYML68]|uniref:efflux RND transporter periplasmic adaptor subunit n=1 Tax=Paenibacillus sp. YYML68 TaxID=2909250 RepID=UPI0024916095|nr:efflux RND transporter periplasmic adaptor subunit [Paenibacillus sp. YYML68]